MNKLIKGSIAGAAGIVLLLGGAGTFALWNDSVAAAGGNVQSGVLTVALNGSPAWADASTDKTSTTWVPGTDKLVPGDTVTYTQNFDVVATGKNLKANLSFDPTTVVIKPALLGITVPNVSGTGSTVQDAVTVVLTATKVSGNATLTAGTTNNYTITAGATGGTTTITVVFTIKFDKLVPINKVGQALTDAVSMATPGVTLVQVRS